MKILNTTTTLQIVRTRGGDDVDLQPGETKTVDVNKEDPRFVAFLSAGVFVEVDSKEKSKAAPAPSAT